MEIALNLAAAAMLLIAFVAVGLFAFIARDLAVDLMSGLLEAGGQRRAYFRTLRGCAIGSFTLAVACVGFSIPEDGQTPSVGHARLILALVAVSLFGVSAALFRVWWVLAGREVQGT